MKNLLLTSKKASNKIAKKKKEIKKSDYELTQNGS